VGNSLQPLAINGEATKVRFRAARRDQSSVDSPMASRQRNQFVFHASKPDGEGE